MFGRRGSSERGPITGRLEGQRGDKWAHRNKRFTTIYCPLFCYVLFVKTWIEVRKIGGKKNQGFLKMEGIVWKQILKYKSDIIVQIMVGTCPRTLGVRSEGPLLAKSGII